MAPTVKMRRFYWSALPPQQVMMSYSELAPDVTCSGSYNFDLHTYVGYEVWLDGLGGE